MDEKTKNAIALKKFSIIGPVLNGQVSNNTEYFRQVASSPIDMPYYGMQNDSYKTLESWLCDYNKRGIEGLARGTSGVCQVSCRINFYSTYFKARGLNVISRFAIDMEPLPIWFPSQISTLLILQIDVLSF